MAAKKPFALGPAQLSSLLGVLAAVVVAVFANVLVARHFTRWDWTTAKRYTLTDATLTTLRQLEEPVDVWVLLGSADPLGQSVKQLLVAYQAETARLRLHYVDPDRDTAALEDVRKKYKIDTGRTEDGRVVTDAILVVARGDQHWFLGPGDMVEVTSETEGRAKPREEQAITSAIRNVLGGTKAKLCFTAGHGELALNDGSTEGLGLFADVLTKDNYDLATVDTTDPDAHAPFDGCTVVVVAAARGAFSPEEENRLRTYLLSGGSLLACLSPVNAASPTGMTPPGLADALAPFGIALDEDLVFETDPKVMIPESRGIRFFATVKPHGVTSGLVREGSSDEGVRDAPRVMVNFTRSLHHAPPGKDNAIATDLLTSSPGAFAVASIKGAADWTGAPEKTDRDKAGPLVLAMASERPKTAPTAPHGPRAVVIGTGSVIIRQTLTEPLPIRGAAILVESAISWLASKPAILDVPARPTVGAGIRITDESRIEVQRYVLIYMPLAVLLLGGAVALRRRSTEGAPRDLKKPPS